MGAYEVAKVNVLTIHLGDQRYAVPTSAVVEVVPLVELRSVPRAPAFVAGMCNYRGRIAAVVDLGELVVGHPSSRRYSTRIIFVHHPQSTAGVLGLMAEGVTETLELDDADIAAGATVPSPETPYLGAVVQHQTGLVQLFDLGPLLPGGIQVPELQLAEVGVDGDVEIGSAELT